MVPPDENSLRPRGIRTHYDNLKVARNAPIEVIRAAYRALSAKYHPDHNPGSDQAARAMKIINSAYEVLSDPISRHQHDQWISSIESDSIESAPPSSDPPRPPTRPGQSHDPSTQAAARSPWKIGEKRAFRSNAIKLLAAFVFALAAGVGLGVFMSSTTPANAPKSDRGSIPTRAVVPAPVSEPPPARHPYVRPSLAPSGRLWPLTSSYLNPYPAVIADDLSSLTVDNGHNGSDVLVKLFDRRSQRPSAVRVFFLRAYEPFKVENIQAGAYDIRFQDLDSGVISKSQPFNVDQIQEPDGSWQYTVMTLTLYVVSKGNTRFETISPADF
jgi:hypothetical protein